VGRRSTAPRRRRRATAGDHSRTGGVGRVAAEGGGRPRREGTPKQSKKPAVAAYADAVHHYTMLPVFPESATTTPPTQCECHCNLLHLSSCLVFAL
jgi:hypothetical protein